jgi:hypothetical protein
MAKKKSNQQPKQPNAADVGDSATGQIISQPANTSQDDVHTPATTRLSFFNFITVANTEEIKNFLELADTTQESDNLRYIWERAYEDG